MLQSIRDQVKGWLAVLIFTIMIIPFAFWGINYYFDQSGGIVALKVNGEKITLADYQRAYQNARRQWQASSGAPVREEAEPLLKQQAVDGLIQVELLKQTGEKAGLHVGDREAWEFVRQLPAFNDDNGFNEALLTVAANQLGLTPAGFMAQIKQDMAAEQLRNALFATEFVTQPEIAAYSGLRYQTRDFSYAILSSDEFKETLEITDEQVQSRYEGSERYLEPEKVRIAYLVLSRARIAEEVYLEEGELEAWFEENKQNYEIQETRKVKQILVKLPEESSGERVEEMKILAGQLYELARDGAKFEDVVVEHSGEHADSIEFSEFGFISGGALEAEVDEVAFTLAEGEISEPVQSRLGFHILGVDEIQGATEATLEDKRAEAEQDLKDDKAAKQLYELTDRLATLTYENPDTLEVAAEELDLEVQNSDFISRESPGAGIVSEPAVISAAFSEEVLLEENNSDLIELDDERYLALRVLEHQPSRKKPVEEVRDEIITRMKYELASERTQEQGEAILAQLAEGQSKEALAAEFSLEWKDANGVTREDENINRAVLRAAFRTGAPAQEQPEFGGASLGTGDYAVVVVYASREAEQDALEQEKVDALRDQLLRAGSGGGWSEYTSNLQTNANVTIYEDVL